MTVKNTRVYDDLANAYVKGVTNAADLDLFDVTCAGIVTAIISLGSLFKYIIA